MQDNVPIHRHVFIITDVMEHNGRMKMLAEKLVDLVRTQGLIRPCDLALLGIPRISLTRAVRHG